MMESWQVEAQAGDTAQIGPLSSGTGWNAFVNFASMHAASCDGWQIWKLVWLFVDVVRI
jgi:hypothetical protein